MDIFCSRFLSIVVFVLKQYFRAFQICKKKTIIFVKTKELFIFKSKTPRTASVKSLKLTR